MAKQKTFFKTNIRFLRERQAKTQDDLAAILNITRNKLQALESRTINPAVEDLIQFSEYFKVSIDSMLKVNLPKLNTLELRELLEGNDIYISGSKLRVLAITVNHDNRENIEYVPVKAKAGYLAGYHDPKYIATLPRFNMPNLPKSGTFRMFPTIGDSMLPFPENSDVIGQYVQNWKSLKPDTPCIVILKGEQDFVFKLVTVQDNGKVLLTSTNKMYQPYEVNANDVLEVWKYYKHQTNKLPEEQTDLQEIKAMIINLEAKLSKSVR